MYFINANKMKQKQNAAFKNTQTKAIKNTQHNFFIINVC